MSDTTAKRWIIALVFGYVLVFVGFEVSGYGPEWFSLEGEKPSQDSSYGTSRTDKNKNAKAPLNSPPYRVGGNHIMPSVSNGGHPPIANPEEQEQTQREKDDLEAQQDMAWWAMLMFFATAIAVVVTGFGVWYVRKTLIETTELRIQAQRTNQAAIAAVSSSDAAAGATLKAAEAALEANEIQRKLLAASQWTRVELPDLATVTSPLDWHGNNLIARFELELTSVGAGPAVDVVVAGRVFAERKGSMDNLIKELTAKCERIAAQTGRAISPGSNHLFPVTLAVRKEDIGFFFHSEGRDAGRIKNIIPMVVCYCYRGIIEDELKSRWGLYLVSFSGLNSPVILDEVPIGSDHVKLARAETGR